MVRPHSRSVSFMNICMLQEQSLQYCLLPLHTTKIMLPRNQPWIYLPPWMDCTLNNWVERVLLSCWPRLMRSSQRCLAVRNKQLMLKNLQENKEILKFGQKWELEESLPAIFTKYAILTLPSLHSIWSSRSVMAPIFNLLPQTGGFNKKHCTDSRDGSKFLLAPVLREVLNLSRSYIFERKFKSTTR